MEVQVTITEICPVETIVSKTTGKEYHKYRFVGKTHDPYPKEICFETMGDDKFAQFNIMVGKDYVVSFDLDSRRWNDKFFTSATAWKVMPVQVQQQGYQQPNTVYNNAPAPQPMAQPQYDQNNPF